MRVRVVVYNVRGFRDGFDRLVRLVGHFEPDVVLSSVPYVLGGEREPEAVPAR